MREVLNSRLFKIIYTIFVIIFTIFIASYLLFICLERKNIADYAFYIVPDNSMKGSYNKNDVVVIKKIDKLILEVGNDIVYYGTTGGLEDKLIIHRIISIDNTNKNDVLFTTQSINSALPDPVVHKKEIIGKVLGKVNILTDLNHIVKSQIGFFLVIFLPLVLILIIEIIKTIITLKLERISFTDTEILEEDDRGKHEQKDEE